MIDKELEEFKHELQKQANMSIEDLEKVSIKAQKQMVAEHEQYIKNQELALKNAEKYEDIVNNMIKGLMFDLNIPKDKFEECKTLLNKVDISEMPIFNDRILDLHYITEIVKEHLKKFQYRDEFDVLINSN